MAVTVRADPQAPGSPYWDLWICILPLRRVPPSGGPASTVMVNVSLVPGSPLSVTLTVKVHGASFLTQVPPNMAVLPSITSVVRVTLWTFAPRALLTYWRSPPTGPVAVCACTTKPKVPLPPATLIAPPPVTLPTDRGGGRMTTVAWPTPAAPSSSVTVQVSWPGSAKEPELTKLWPRTMVAPLMGLTLGATFEIVAVVLATLLSPMALLTVRVTVYGVLWSSA